MLMKTWACQGERLDICRGCSNEPARNYLVQIGSSAQPYHLQLEDFSSVLSFKFVRSMHHQHHHHHHRPDQGSSPPLVSLAAHIEDDRSLADLVGDDQERRWRVDRALHCVTVHLVVHDLTEDNYLFFPHPIKHFLYLLILLDWLSWCTSTNVSTCGMFRIVWRKERIHWQGEEWTEDIQNALEVCVWWCCEYDALYINIGLRSRDFFSFHRQMTRSAYNLNISFSVSALLQKRKGEAFFKLRPDKRTCIPVYKIILKIHNLYKAIW